MSTLFSSVGALSRVLARNKPLAPLLVASIVVLGALKALTSVTDAEPIKFTALVCFAVICLLFMAWVIKEVWPTRDKSPSFDRSHASRRNNGCDAP